MKFKINSSIYSQFFIISQLYNYSLRRSRTMRQGRRIHQQFYQQNPEQFNSFNSEDKWEPKRNNQSRENELNQLHNSRQRDSTSRYYNHRYLPPIRLLDRQSQYNQSFVNSYRDEQDKTQIYLKNCQYIAKNLRELKQKRQKDRYRTMQTEPSTKDLPLNSKKLYSRQDLQFYPKNPYASSQTKAYNVSASKKAINNDRKSKHQIASYQSKPKTQEDPYFQSPENLRIGAKKFNKLSNSRINSQTRKDNLQKKKGQQNSKIQKQLLSCLNELSHFLKSQNKNKQPDKKEGDQLKNKRKNRKHYIPSQSQSENSQSCNKHKSHRTERVQSLKYKAIIALKRLNQRSRQFMNLTLAHNQQIMSKQTREKIKKKPTVKFVEDVEAIPLSQRRNSQSKDSKKTKPIVSIPVDLKASRSNSKLSTSKSMSNEDLNSEFAKQLVSYLQRQQDQNLQLSSCLKQMTSYLKIHNAEIGELRASRLQQKSRIKIQLTQNEKKDRLRKAVVKNLKKVRLRGNIFKEKIQKFKNERSNLTIKKNQEARQAQTAQKKLQEKKDKQKQGPQM